MHLQLFDGTAQVLKAISQIGSDAYEGTVHDSLSISTCGIPLNPETGT